MGRTGADDDMEALVADVFARNCTSREILEVVASKWGVLALLALREGSYRYNALRRRVEGISEKMLAQMLQQLERDGMVVRDVQATIPPRVEYSLTPIGEEVAARLHALVEVLEASVDEVSEAQKAFDARRAG
jgi:DNA-binding HxlR family transcriptional regulator